MKKHIVGILILILVLALLGVGIWFVVKKSNSKSLYNISSEFVSSHDADTLLDNILQAESLYQSKVLSSETRLTTLHTIITKIDGFEADLTSYLILSNKKNSTTDKLSKTYGDISSSRKVLINDYNEYITRMQGNTNIDGTALQDLYNDIFNKTIDYIYNYNDCFKSTSNYVFDKVYTADSIKTELYSLYSAGVSNLLNNISNNRFASTNLINRLNNGIKLIDNNLYLLPTIDGGEFSVQAQNFKRYFNSCDLDSLVNNFETYCNISINPSTETSNEKLAVYYAKQILEI